MSGYSRGMAAREVRLLGPGDMEDGRLSAAVLHLVCEMACHNILAPLFGDDDTSLGAHNDIWFWGEAAPGELLLAEAVIARIDGRRVEFNVVARAGIREIARGLHERALVSRSRFTAGLPVSRGPA